jgi:Leucine Rich Repeat/Leucine Rich repeat
MLQAFYLGSNKISDPISSIPNTLHDLDLSENQTNGSFPYEACNMTNLELLDLSSNAISGEIPDNCWHNISNLEYINLANNQITGELPDSIKSLAPLTHFAKSRILFESL